MDSLTQRDSVLDGLYPEPEPAITSAEYAHRLDRVRTRMAQSSIDCLFISAPEGMYYLSGYRSAFMQGQNPKQWPPTSGIAVHVNDDDYILFDTDRETVMHRTYTGARDVRYFPPGRTRDGTAFIADELAMKGWLRGTVGLEYWSYRPNRAVSERFQGHIEAHGGQVVDASDVLREVRWLKSADEMSCLREAGRVGRAGLRAAAGTIRPGAMELTVLGEVLGAMGREGGEVPGVIPPVLSGPKTASPHALASDRRIGADEPVVVDLSGVSARYHANLARTWWTGKVPADVESIAQRAAQSLAVMKAALKPGVTADALAKEMVRYYKEVDLWEIRSWVGGYEMGIAFPPAWTGNYVFDPDSEIGCDKVFEAGTAINFENQFFLPRNQGLFFLIQTVLLEPDGAQLLSEEVPYRIESTG